jgi:hypothetical protein
MCRKENLVNRSNDPAGGNKFRKPKSRQKLWLTLLTGMLLLVFCLCVMVTIVPAVFPEVGANMADMLRSVFGPQPVAVLESVSFQFQDGLNQLWSRVNGGQVQIKLSDQPQNSFGLSTPAAPAVPSTQLALPLPTRVETAGTVVTPTPATVQKNVVTDGPQLDWAAYGPNVNGGPAMAEAVIMLDPQRSYTGIVLVRIDLTKIQLHMMPGYLEPSHSTAVVQAFPELGMVPTNEQNKLVVAFNGGFKFINGHFGMMVNGLTLVQPKEGIATVALYQDGHVQIGVWGKDINQSPDVIAYRQNCPPLLEEGRTNPELSSNNRKAWGYTGNSDITWRTGLGITKDGRYLIYAVGNGTSAKTIAVALMKAGAYNGMQLDINQAYTHFYTYQPSDPATSQGFSMTGKRLVEEMINNPHLYLTPNVRDFFYMTELTASE